MSREIRFRAYWKNVGVFDVVQIGSGESITIAVPVEYKGSNPIETSEEYQELDDLAEYEIMQFSGLTDKHGRRIFEEDICKVTGGWLGDLTLKMLDLNSFHFWSEVEGNLEDGATYEVIGNVHENGDLLKQKGGE